MSSDNMDPFGAFVAAHQRELPATRANKRFNAGEHAWLGGHGAEGACEELLRTRGIRVDKSLFESISRHSGRELLPYGELVALSGDFYESPDEMFYEKPSPIAWLWERNDLSDLRQIFDQELDWIEKRRKGTPGGSYPENNVRFAWNAKSYVELALSNTDHFGWHNVCAYCRHHAAALELAREARGRNDETFRCALYTNAFADHFLTDGFAAGHIRVPRAEIRTWADSKGWDEKIAGALSKILHDQDGHIDVHSLHGVAENKDERSDDGLLVCDSTGATWRTYCDGQLFLKTDADRSLAIAKPVAAVAASVLELLLAWRIGETPSSTFAATKYVPFPHPNERALIEKFPGDMPQADLDSVWSNVQWYSKMDWLGGLKQQYIRELFEALPQLMADFRAHVRGDASDAILKTRVDPFYVDAFKQIR